MRCRGRLPTASHAYYRLTCDGVVVVIHDETLERIYKSQVSPTLLVPPAVALHSLPRTQQSFYPLVHSFRCTLQLRAVSP